jgi:pyridoxal phosphate enzyme (YggS family)
VDTLSGRLEAIRERMARAAERAGRRPESVRLLAVTKGFPAAAVRDAMALGLREFGENRVQEAESKISEVGPGPRWHLVGHLQTNKAKRAVQLFEEIHSLDSARLAEELAKRAAMERRTPVCWIEVNTSGDASKFGVPPAEAAELMRSVGAMRPLRLAGLMTIGPLHGGPEGARASFRALRALRDRGVEQGWLEEDAGLSMGMSDDFEIAVEEGATVVRIGSALLGPRPA